jgi:hypothetical protein
MKRRVLIILTLLTLAAVALMGLRSCQSNNGQNLRTITFRPYACWLYESTVGCLDPLTLVSFPEGISATPESIDLRIVGETTVVFRLGQNDDTAISRTVRVIEPLITIIKPVIYLSIGETYNPEENIISGCDHQCQPSFIEADRPQSLTVTVQAQSEGLASEKSFEVIVSSENMVWVIDQPYQPSQTVNVWVIDRPAVSEQGHWQVIEEAVEEQGHYEEVEVPEQGHWENVIVRPAVEEQGHWETVHHEAVTHQKPIYENYKYWLFEFSDGYSVKVYQYELTEMGLTATQYAGRYEDTHPGVTGQWHSEIEKRLVGYETIVDQPAYDEQVWIVDVPYQPALTERRWIVDQPAHTQKRWVVDVPARPERKQWVVDQPAQPEQGHWEERLIPEVPEVGHWEKAQ